MGVLRAGALPGLHMQPTAQVIDGSLKFERRSSNYLSRTFGAGNRKTYTVSFWHKHSNHSEGASIGTGGGVIFSTGTVGAGARGTMGFSGPTNGGNEDNFMIGHNATGSTWKTLNSVAFYRDFSAWQNFVIAVDVTQSNASDRVRFYVNGVQQALSGSFPLNENQQFNNNVGHAIGRYNAEGTDYYSGLLSNFYFIDGSALAPGYFGFTDPLTGTWRPKKLRQGDPTVNDGTTWSSYLSDSSGASNLFDGDLSTFYGPGSSTETWTPAKPIEVISQVRIYYSSGSTSRNFEVNDNGNVVATGTGTKWVDLNFTGSLRKISGTNGWNVGAIEIDGVTLVDDTTTTVDFGTNGFYLPMDDEDRFHLDQSGKNNNFTQNNFSGDSTNPDVINDSPSGAVSGGRAQTGITTTSSAPANYATFNPVDDAGTAGLTLSYGNLSYTNSSSDANNTQIGTLSLNNGKFYFENLLTAAADVPGSTSVRFGITRNSSDSSSDIIIYNATGQVDVLGTSDTNPSSYTANNVIGLAVDCINGSVEFFKDNVSTGIKTFTVGTDTWSPFLRIYKGGSNDINGTINFGQKPFKYAPPQGFLPLNSASARPNTVITRPDQYVGVATHNGSGGTQSINVGIKPDLVWIKSRSGATAYEHLLFDTVRGATKYIKSNSDAVEQTNSSTLSSFDSNGFTLGSDNEINKSAHTYVDWCWRAGGAPTATNDNTSGAMDANSVSIDGVLQSAYTPSGSPSVYPKKMSIGTKQGFSIVTWSRGSGTDSIPHGLSQAPDLIIQKSTSAQKRWQVGFSALGWDRRLYLNLTDEDSDSSSFGYTDNFGPTDTLLRTGGTSYVDGDMIAYCWHNVPGLQKFGKYTGLNSKAKFVELGFRPAIVVIKFTQGTDVGSHAGWKVIDNQRNKFNPTGISQKLAWDVDENENGGTTISTSEGKVDFLSNGFRIRDNHAPFNTSSRDYVYMAWAEAPFSNLFGGQSTGR